MTSALLGVTPRERSGIASGVLNSVRQAAGALGIALAAALIVRLGPVAGFHLLAELWSAMIGIALVVALLGITRAPRRTAS